MKEKANFRKWLIVIIKIIISLLLEIAKEQLINQLF